MWTAPPPAWNQTKPGWKLANIQTAVIQVLNGSTDYHVRWRYTLLEGQSIDMSIFRLGVGISQPDMIGNIISPGTPSERTTILRGDDYQTRFSLQSTSEFSTLTIKKVTERENVTFQCSLQVGPDIWTYNIRIAVTGRIREWTPFGDERPYERGC